MNNNPYQNNNVQPDAPASPYEQKQCIPYSAEPKKKRVFNTAEIVLAVICIVFGYTFNKFVIDGNSPWIMTLIMVSVAVLAVVFEACLGGKINSASIGFALAAAVFSLAFVLCSETSIVVLCALASLFSLVMSIHKTFDKEVEKIPGVFFDFDCVKALFAKPFASFGDLFAAIFSRGGEKKKKTPRLVFWVLIGLILSIIPTVIVVSLLSYDEAFNELISKIQFDNADFWTHVVCFVFGVPIAMYAFGLWMSSVDRKLKGFNQDSSKTVKSKIRFIPAPVIIAMITPVLIVYIVFFFSQFDYYVSAFSGQLAEGYEVYSKFAREGFFQLCTVTVINAFMCGIMYYFMKRKENSILMKIYTIVISLFTLILIATAFSKMYLYITYYGLTVNRVYTALFMLVEALIFIFLIVRMFVKRFNFTIAYVICTSVVLAAFAVLNAPAMISHFNTEKVLSGESWVLDVEYYEQLGAAAVPDALRIEEYCTGANRAEAKKFLDNYKISLEEENESSLCMTLPEIKAANSLKDRIIDKEILHVKNLSIDEEISWIEDIQRVGDTVQYSYNLFIYNNGDSLVSFRIKGYFDDEYNAGIVAENSSYCTWEGSEEFVIAPHESYEKYVTFSLPIATGYEGEVPDYYRELPKITFEAFEASEADVPEL